MKKIVIIGSGGFAKEVSFLIEDINKERSEWNFLGYIDKNAEIGSYSGKYEVHQHDEWLDAVDFDLHVVFGIGQPQLISKIHKRLVSNQKIKFPNLIHRNAIGDWERIELGVGNIITAGNIFTTDIKVGSFNIFNLDCTVGHDTVIGNYNVFNPSVNLSGGVHIADECLIGTGSQILQYKKVVTQTIVGAGAVVTKDLLEPGVYVGSPAKKLERK